jgi:hypothetical protein
MKIKVSKNISEYCLILGISLGLSILFQIYLIGVTAENGVLSPVGGSATRLFMKLVALFLIYASLYRAFSIKSFSYNLILKIPLMCYLLTVIAVIPFIIGNAYSQAINLLFFVPFLFIDFRGNRGRQLFSFLVKVIVCVVVIQLALEAVIKIMGLQLVVTLVGGMGNANTFGLFLIFSALALRILYGRTNSSRLMFVLVAGTGSLVCTLVAALLLFQSFVLGVRLKTLLLFVLLLALGSSVVFLGRDWFFPEEFNPELSHQVPLWHSFKKFQGLIQYVLAGGEAVGSASVSVRVEYTLQGLALLSENPMAIIFGHPNFLPFYSGDGFYIALLVTVGLPITFLFLICNLIAVYRGFKENDSLSIFSSYVILTFLIFFLTNRILDYWPTGLIYVLTFSFLIRKRDIVLNKS